MIQVSAKQPGEKQKNRGFWCLFIAQIQGAFSDSLFKFMVIFLITSMLQTDILEQRYPGIEISPSIEELPVDDQEEIKEELINRRDPWVTTILIVFSIPMLVFAMTAGFFADRFSKARVVFSTKSAEILIMFSATLALYHQSVAALLTIVFLMSMQSSFFSPSRLGLMPNLLSVSKLSWGNGIMGMGTFFSIIAGGFIAGVLSEVLGIENAWLAGLLLIVLACVGALASTQIPTFPVGNPDAKLRLNFLGQIWSNLRLIRHDRILMLAISGSVFFWFLAALLGEPTVFAYGKDLLELGDIDISILRAFLAIGIAAGCFLAGFLSSGKIEYGLIPLGAIGLTFGAGLLGLPGLSFAWVAIFLFIIGISGGFFVVPINSIVQFRPDPTIRGGIIATERWLTAAGVLMAALAFYLLKMILDLQPTEIFFIGAVTTLVVTLYTFWLMPDALARLVLWFLTHTFYRVKVVGRENVPDEGGALLVANHLSMADALFVIASTHRQIRFIMHRKMYRRWWIYPVARMLRAIPIASDMSPRDMITSLNEAKKSVDEGHVVCIFAEGQIGHFGQMLPFRKGLNRILKGSDAPIIPIHLDNVWGSIFSFERGKFYFKIPRQIPYPITVSYGEPMPSTTAPHEVRKQVIELGAEAWKQRKSRIPTIPLALIQTARRNRLKKALSDTQTTPISFMRALCRAITYCRKIAKQAAGESHVAVGIPPSVNSTLVNWSILLAGKVPCNLDLNGPPEILLKTIANSGIKQLIIEKKSRNLLPDQVPVDVLVLEELTCDITTWDYFKAWFLVNFCPKSLVSKMLAGQKKVTIDDLATISMTRGRTGVPKLVQLSHYNVVSNVQQLNQVFNFTRTDRLATVVPTSHALGFSSSVVIPSVLGVPVHFHHQKDDGRAIGEVVQHNEVTTFICTPEILESCIKGASPEQFGSLTTVLVGGMSLNESLENQFEEKFGVKPLEGYGCTECSPVVSVNTFDFRTTGKRQVGAKKGTLGMGLPGLALRVIDPETGQECGFDTEGILQVKGPNVMVGYLGDRHSTDNVIKNGWFSTGDLASMDADGFIRFGESNS